MEHQRRANSKKIPAEALTKLKKQHSMERMFTVLAVAVMIGIFCVISAASSRFGWRFDLTANQIFQITDTTRQLLSNLDQDVTITYCNSRGQADTNIREVLDRYDAAFSRVNIEYLDLDANPAFVEELAKKNIKLEENGVLVTSGNQSRYLNWQDLYQFKSYTDENGAERKSLTGLQAETKLTSSILAVSDPDLPGIAFTAGHNENTTDALKELVINGNFDVEQVILGVDELRDSVTTLVIAGPRRDFTLSDLEILDTFMARGGNLCVFRDPEVESLPNLDGFLRQWGLVVSDLIVLEPTQQMDSPLNIIPSFGISMINVFFSENASYVVLPETRALELNNINGCLTNTVLKSTSSSYGKRFAEMTALTRGKEDASGPFTVAATSEREYRLSDGETGTQYVFLTACSDFYADRYLDTDSVANADLVLQVLSYMNGSEAAVNIPAKSLSAGSISVTRGGTMAFGAVFVVLAPVSLLLLGIAVFLKRRHS